jgi:hypothetical protein
LALFFIVRAIIVYCRSVLLSKANAVCVTVVRVWMAVWCGGDER